MRFSSYQNTRRISGWDTSIRLAAVSALGEMSDLQAVEALIEALKDSDSGVRQAAAATLGQLGYTRAVEPLVDETQSALLAVAQQDWDRVVSLGSAALAPLVAALRDNKYWVRQQAAAALVSLGWQPVDETQSASTNQPLATQLCGGSRLSEWRVRNERHA